MPTLHLGVIDLPYKNQQQGPRASKRKKARTRLQSPLTTGDVAEILEAKYHPMRLFFEVKADKIVKEFKNSYQGALESILMGAPTSLDPAGEATSNIETMFKKFITNREIERLGYPGVPTKAALAGINHRLLHPHARSNPRRPSFVDTSHYVDAFKAWISE